MDSETRMLSRDLLEMQDICHFIGKIINYEAQKNFYLIDIMQIL